MEWLNYHHLRYFWMVVKEGTMAKAAKRLRVAQPTISAQIKALEESAGVALFSREGRALQLTEEGETVFRYAEEIFSIGNELVETLNGHSHTRALKLRVGISDALPKLVCHDLLEPALRLPQSVQIVCQADKTENLLAALAIRGLDLILSDAPIRGNVKVKAFNHLLGECGTTFFATPTVARKYRRNFPDSLNDAPFLMPSHHSAVRRALDHWFDEIDVHPWTVAEFDDMGLLKSFGEGGTGVFAAASVVEDAVREHYGVHVVGRTEEVRERFYAITVERKIKNPAVAAIAKFAKHNLFAQK